MHDVKANLHRCAHCFGTGTCKNGSAETSCAMCIKINEISGKNLTGLPCGICGGIGQAEAKTERINKRMPALMGFAVVIILIVFVFISAVLDSPNFNELVAFSGPVIGSILGFFYSIRKG